MGIAALALLAPVGFAQKQADIKKERAPREIDKLTYPKLHDIKMPSVVRDVLPNGVRLILVEDHELPQVELRALVRGGRVAEPKGKAGLAELFGEVHRTGGIRTMSGDKVDEFLERLGASVETTVGETYGEVSGKTLVEHLDKVLPIFAEFLMMPAFAQEKVDLGKIHLRSIIARRNDNVQMIARRELQKLIYGADSPYARQFEHDDIDALSRADLVGFHAKYYRPDSTILAVWGDFQVADMKARLASALAAWQAQDSPPPIPKPRLPPSAASVNYIEKKDIEQTFIVMGHIGLRLDDPDYPAINLLSEILGGGFASRIFVSVRTTKGLAYGAGGWMIPAYDHLGSFSFYTSTKPASTAEALSTMLAEIKMIREGPVTDAELRRAKEGYLNSYAFEFDSIGKIVNRLATYDFYGYPADFNVKLRDAVEQVTKEDILRVAQKHLKPDAMTILAIGRAEQFDKPLSIFGKVTTIDIRIPEPKPKEVIPEATPESLKAGTALLVKAAKAAGEQALLSLADITSEGTNTVKTPMGEMALKGKIVFVLPNRLHIELATPMGAVVQVLDGEKGWMKMGQMSQDLPESAVGELRRGLYTMNGGVLLLKQALEGKVQGQALGKAQFEGKDAEAVLVRLGETPIKVFLSSDGVSLLGFKLTAQTQEGPAEVVETLSAYATIADLRVPMESVQKVKGELRASIRASSVKMNQGFTEELFAKPAPSAPK
jgi:predicted Zn-dependent peptidase